MFASRIWLCRAAFRQGVHHREKYGSTGLDRVSLTCLSLTWVFRVNRKSGWQLGLTTVATIPPGPKNGGDASRITCGRGARAGSGGGGRGRRCNIGFARALMGRACWVPVRLPGQKLMCVSSILTLCWCNVSDVDPALGQSLAGTPLWQFDWYVHHTPLNTSAATVAISIKFVSRGLTLLILVECRPND